jgi:hypothetical protein
MNLYSSDFYSFNPFFLSLGNTLRKLMFNRKRKEEYYLLGYYGMESGSLAVLVEGTVFNFRVKE